MATNWPATKLLGDSLTGDNLIGDNLTRTLFEQLPETQKRGGRGITELWSKIDPVWKMESEELIDFMAERVIHENGNAVNLFGIVYDVICGLINM
jgi:hypothetical protein